MRSAEVLARDELHHECANAATLFEPVDLRNIRVVQRGQRLGLVGEPGKPFRVIRKGIGQDLQRDIAIELGVPGAIHLAHATLADQLGDSIRPEACAGAEGHRVEYTGRVAR